MPKATRWSACTAQREDGSFCDVETIRDAPFPICVRHAGQILTFLQGRIADAPRTVILDELASLSERRRLGESRSWTTGESVVYYVQIGDYIKVGTTTNLRRRLAGYPPNRRLLATEPGADDVERARHAEFRESRAMGREWFRPTNEVLAHVNGLRRKVGATPIVAA